MLNGTSHHPKRRERWTHPAPFTPIPGKAKLNSRNEQKVHGAWPRPHLEIKSSILKILGSS